MVGWLVDQRRLWSDQEGGEGRENKQRDGGEAGGDEGVVSDVVLGGLQQHMGLESTGEKHEQLVRRGSGGKRREPSLGRQGLISG